MHAPGYTPDSSAGRCDRPLRNVRRRQFPRPGPIMPRRPGKRLLWLHLCAPRGQLLSLDAERAFLDGASELRPVGVRV
eukprot:scaffold10003_cov32-Tisochrysis_lutea.AAC.4